MPEIVTLDEFVDKNPSAPEWVKQWAKDIQESNSVRCCVTALAPERDKKLMELPYETLIAMEEMK